MADMENNATIAPSSRLSTAVPSALAIAEGKSYFFYYNSDGYLHMAVGKEKEPFVSAPITVGQDKEGVAVPRLRARSPALPLAAGYDAKKKEMRVFYIDIQNNWIVDVFSTNLGQIWNYGTFGALKVELPFFGTFAAHLGDFWRIIAASGTPDSPSHTLFYESTPGNWERYTIP